MGQPKFRFKPIILTPKLAQQFLDKNISNRMVKIRTLNFLENQLTSKNFEGFNGDTIKIDFNGNLWDGQHRCMAVIKTGISIETFLFVGEKKITVNTGITPETLADYFYKQGYKRHNMIAGIYNALYKIMNSSLIKMSLKEGIKYHNLFINDINHLISNADYRQTKGLSRSNVFAGFIIMIWITGKKNELTQIFDSLMTGVDLKKTDPVLLLRNYLLFDTQSAFAQTSKIVVLKKTINALYSIIYNKPIERLYKNDTIYDEVIEKFREKVRSLL